MSLPSFIGGLLPRYAPARLLDVLRRARKA